MSLTDRYVDAHTILQVVVGSRAFGLATAASDTDRRGVYALPAAAFWPLTKPPQHHEGPLPEQLRWEVERVCVLGLAANPNVLEVLHSPLVETCTPLGGELRELTPAFLSRRVVDTYLRYAQAQFGKAERGIARSGSPVWRHVMHLIRLLTAGGHLMRTGELVLDVGADRDRLLAVKAGDLPWAEVVAWRDRLVDRLVSSLDHSPLPAEPDTDRVERWLVSVRRRSVAVSG
ncbi:nucleotidyltransferase domain-containing protein [Micromonospora cathayae]|uniref:Nucleotidyltransferase domain-containing protein n=1 Tax=Micromonospora cathayae TaxID=3028804 RepID=A0ABY7ZLI6_9ACTN|nr:nucleotidyltransferase domain-containing protein [Micromonospora sp. HUAS 3]WDZ83388.1 nucleotidyltransferase domain-containing protein [Micromonospora sp. HUAS 3]